MCRSRTMTEGRWMDAAPPPLLFLLLLLLLLPWRRAVHEDWRREARWTAWRRRGGADAACRTCLVTRPEENYHPCNESFTPHFTAVDLSFILKVCCHRAKETKGLNCIVFLNLNVALILFLDLKFEVKRWRVFSRSTTSSRRRRRLHSLHVIVHGVLSSLEKTRHTNDSFGIFLISDGNEHKRRNKV